MSGSNTYNSVCRAAPGYAGSARVQLQNKSLGYFSESIIVNMILLGLESFLSDLKKNLLFHKNQKGTKIKLC